MPHHNPEKGTKQMPKPSTVQVALYRPCKNKNSWRVMFRDPAQANKWVWWSFPDEQSAKAAHEDRVAYVNSTPFVPAPSANRAHGGPHTMDELFEALQARWASSGAAQGTMDQGDSVYRTWVRPALGQVSVWKWCFTPKLTLAIFNKGFDMGRAPSTMLGVKRLLRTMLSEAHDLGWAPRSADPLRKARHRGFVGAAKQYVRPEARPTTAQADALATELDRLGAARGLPGLGPMCKVASRGGLRFGEQAALRPSSLVAPQVIEVKQAWQQIRKAGRPVLGLTKNRQSRQVVLPASVWLELKVRADEVERDHGPGGLLFPGPKGPGQPWTDSEFRRVFIAAARAAGWRMTGDTRTRRGLLRGGHPVLAYKSLRHHAATWMHDVAKWAWPCVSRYLGHHSVQFTIDRYVRSEDQADEENCRRVAGL
jgi:integrase